MFSKISNAQVCDASKVDSSTAAGNKIFLTFTV